ncbi:MAG: KTSC domain-containing protein [Rhizobiaceae bacterium]|nr:KTSC domain-containing protein [Rhizobiaceae bacterium]
MPRFNSSAIERAEYDSARRVLTIWFLESGGPYDYYGVPQHIYDGLLTAWSKGTYFNDYIREQYSVSH